MTFTLLEAMAYAENNKLNEWLQAFLRNEEGDMPNPNFVLADELQEKDVCIFPPVKMPLNIFKTVRIAKDIDDENDLKWFEYKVEQIINKFPHWDMPPLISKFDGKNFWLNDGSHRYSAMLKMGIDKYYTIVWCDRDNKDIVEKLLEDK